MTHISLTVNGKRVNAEVAPRTHLADFLRENLNHTGTHIGCEHGVCGACTVEIDGEIARSCITYAVCCDGAEIRTIEAFDEDAMMARLRQAFQSKHALQCGYCTPGMLIAARDLVRRKRGLSRAEIRGELSGNLCRCTGYVGIVSAVAEVMGGLASTPVEARVHASSWLGPAPGPLAVETSATVRKPAPPTAAAPLSSKALRPLASIRVGVSVVENGNGTTRLSESFQLPHPLKVVWALMGDVELLARCMPGMSLEGPPLAGVVKGRFRITIGPISASFSGEGRVQRVGEFRQSIAASGSDQKSGSRVRGSVDYALFPVAEESGGEQTRVDVAMTYVLTGPLAQIGRSAIVRDLARRIGEAFAQNLDASLRQQEAPRRQAPLAGGRLLLALIADRLRALVAALFQPRP